MNNYPLPKILNQPLPRSTKLNGSAKFYIFSGSFIYFFVLILLLGSMYPDIAQKTLLKNKGVAAEAEILRLYTEQLCNRRSGCYTVVYRYAPPSYTGVVTKMNIDSSIYYKLEVGQKVPILYDPENPGVSALNINDSLHNTDPAKLLYIGAGGLSCIFLAVARSFANAYRKERKLVQWGQATTNVTIINEKKVYSSSSSSYSIVTYQFTDSKGNTVQGKRYYVPTDKDKLSLIIRELVMNYPVALYNPDNSNENILYPPQYVDILPKEPQGSFSNTEGTKNLS